MAALQLPEGYTVRKVGNSLKVVPMKRKKVVIVKQEEKQKQMQSQKVRIDWADRGKMAVCSIINGKSSPLPKVRKIDPEISLAVEEKFQLGGIATISFDDEGIVRKVESA